MKIEIDFAKPEALRQMKRELEAALAAVDSALKAIGVSNGAQQAEPAAPAPTAAVVGAAPAPAIRTVEDLFHQSGSEFTSKDWITRGTSANIPESHIRNYIRELEGVGRISLIQKGQGRRPSSYRKV